MSSRRGLALLMTLTTVLAAIAVAGPIALLGATREPIPSCHTAASSEAAGPAVNTPPACDLPARLCVVACFGVPEIAATIALYPPAARDARLDRHQQQPLSRSDEVPEPVPRQART